MLQGECSKKQSKLLPPFRQLNKFDTAKATWDTDFNCSSNFQLQLGLRPRTGKDEEGGGEKREEGREGVLLQVLVAFISKPQRFMNFPSRSRMGLHMQSAGQVRKRGMHSLSSRQSQMDMDVDMDMDMNVAKPCTAMRTAVCVHA